MNVIYESERVREKKTQLRSQKQKILDLDLWQHRSKDTSRINDFIMGKLEKKTVMDVYTAKI